MSKNIINITEAQLIAKYGRPWYLYFTREWNRARASLRKWGEKK